jgi:L-alanine-DL-glutamate epimerase-like enolase superfamily enzyme
MKNEKRSLKYVPYSLRLKEPFGTSHGIRESTEGMLVAIRSGDLVGFGEAFMPPYYDEDQVAMAAFFEKIEVETLLGIGEVFEAVKFLARMGENNRAAKAAIDIALHDLGGKAGEISVREMYGINDENPVQTSYTIGFDKPEKMVQKALEAKEFQTLKIKLNGENDVGIITAISEITDQKLFVDANQGWSDMDKAIETSHQLIDLGVALIEQPFPCGKWKETRTLKDNISVPVIADEDVQSRSDIEKLAPYFDGINIKLMKAGGIYPAFEMIKTARKFGLKVLLGCMTESSVGISAAAQLAPLANWCDLDGNLLITNDTCAGVRCVDGELILSKEAGIGLSDESGLRELFGF